MANPWCLDNFFCIWEDDGIMVIHSIGFCRSGQWNHGGWMNTYIFPGAELPTMGHFTQGFQEKWHLEDWQSFGVSYAKTLRAWKDNLNNWKGLEEFDERFRRMWVLLSALQPMCSLVPVVFIKFRTPRWHGCNIQAQSETAQPRNTISCVVRLPFKRDAPNFGSALTALRFVGSWIPGPIRLHTTQMSFNNLHKTPQLDVQPRLVYTKYPSKRQDDCHHIRQPKKAEPATATRWNREITWSKWCHGETQREKMQGLWQNASLVYSYSRPFGHYVDRTKFLFWDPGRGQNGGSSCGCWGRCLLAGPRLRRPSPQPLAGTSGNCSGRCFLPQRDVSLRKCHGDFW